MLTFVLFVICADLYFLQTGKPTIWEMKKDNVIIHIFTMIRRIRRHRIMTNTICSRFCMCSLCRLLSVDGVYPDTDAIRSGQYPVTTELYAVTLADNPNPNVELFVEWMTGPQGQQIVSDTGYIAMYDLE